MGEKKNFGLNVASRIFKLNMFIIHYATSVRPEEHSIPAYNHFTKFIARKINCVM